MPSQPPAPDRSTTDTRAEARRRGYSLRVYRKSHDYVGKGEKCRHRDPQTKKVCDQARTSAQHPKRWEATVVVPTNDGRKREKSKVLPSEQEAHLWAQALRAQIAAGDFVPQAKDSFAEAVDAWLAVKATKVRPVTVRGYVVSVQPALKAWGPRPVQSITAKDVRLLFASQQHRARATNHMMAGSLRGVFRLARLDGLIKADPTADVEFGGKKAVARQELTRADAERIRAHIVGDRNEAGWTLTLAGLRRSEVCGLRWSDIDLDAATVVVARGRVDLGRDSTATTAPKSERGARTLHLPPSMVAAITRTKAIRRAEHQAFHRDELSARRAWSEDSYVLADDRLRPLRPERYSDDWGRLQDAAGVQRKVTLHGARHGAATRLLDAGLPVHQAAAWMGHDAALMLRVYAHADEAGSRAAGAALG